MALAAGARIGAYEVTAAIGAGGMGEVYRARDTKLKRDVALKVLPDSFTSDPDRLARFQREAEVLAALNHPHIAHIHGLEESDGVRALVLEFVDGPTLADRIAEGPIPLDDVLPIARQIAEALEAAHEQGIIHRDLKPANIKLRPDGTVKVLDFGLAKALDKVAAAAMGGGVKSGGTGGEALLNSPTITSPAMTLQGMILGTAAYMSPEQAKGKPADKRSDIWAFGCVLFEMITGRRAFEGEDVSETLARILTKDPEWSALPDDTPEAIRRLLRRCLQRPRHERIADICDARLELTDTAERGRAETLGRKPAFSRRSFVVVALIAAIVAATLGALAAVYLKTDTTSQQVLRFGVSPPAGWTLAVGATRSGPAQLPLALSPDGRSLALLAQNSRNELRLFVRSLDSLVVRELPGTDGAQGPFWSPDGRHLGFYADGKIKRVDVSGGTAVTICSATSFNAATWGTSGIIVFARAGLSFGALQRVNASGGIPTDATALRGDETFHMRPVFLPDGRHFLYRTASPGAFGSVFLGSLDSTDRKEILNAASSNNVVYANGRLLYVRDRVLLAHAFDLDRMQLTGEPVAVVDQIQTAVNAAVFAASATGVLAYFSGPDYLGSSQLVWVDRTGAELGAVAEIGDIVDPELSPDGKWASVSMRPPTSQAAPRSNIWLIDLTRLIKTRYTFDDANEHSSVWSPDSTRIVFNSSRRGRMDLYVKDASGNGTDELLLADDVPKYPSSWSRDGKFLLYTAGSTPSDLWVLPMSGDGERKPMALTQTPFNEAAAQFSPDGRLVAYVSTESGLPQVFVATFPDMRGKRQVSPGSGTHPRWSADGREIFYVGEDGVLMSAAVQDDRERFVVGSVTPLFQVDTYGLGRLNRSAYTVAADGRFLVTVPREQGIQDSVTVVVNWPALVAQ